VHYRRIWEDFTGHFLVAKSVQLERLLLSQGTPLQDSVDRVVSPRGLDESHSKRIAKDTAIMGIKSA